MAVNDTSYYHLKKIQQALLSWFTLHRRDLPWRATPRDSYHILVSELMLQQTQVSRVLPKYSAFLEKWPTWSHLAKASLSEVLIAWEGLGYNRRAKYIWEIANLVMDRFGEKLPSNPDGIESLPGIGPYTTRALRVFAFGEQTYMIDTNIKRILQRVFIGYEKALSTEIEEIAKQSVPSGEADAWHQGLMDFGSAVCLSTPLCADCTLRAMCRANQEAREAGFETYAQYLVVNKDPKKGKSLPFRLTTRFYRGRIIAYLRTGEKNMEDLRHHILITHQLHDVVRFGLIIEDLMKENLIRIHGSNVMLG